VPNTTRFHDYINASDLVISRGGYGAISETLSYGIRHLILIEQNHPEIIESARILKAANRAIVTDLDHFLIDTYNQIDLALNAKLNVSSMKSDGHIQAADRLVKLCR
jgi:UDP-N-acetylglucosamine:LPS N-acetylglucosamine transferase